MLPKLGSCKLYTKAPKHISRDFWILERDTPVLNLEDITRRLYRGIVKLV